jgi:hypothetical protein
LIKPLIVTAVAAAVLWFGWHWIFPSDEAQIVAVLERIATGISSAADEGDVGRIARAASLRDDLAPDVTVEAGAPLRRLTGRDAVIGAAATTSGRVRNLTVTFPDVSVAVAPDGQSATAVVTAEVRFDAREGRSIDARELELEFSRADGQWVISSIVVVETLKRLP